MNRLWQRDMPKSSLEALVVLVALVILFILFVLIPALGLFRPRAPEADTRSQLKVLASILEFDWAPRQATLPVSDEVNAGARLLCEVLDETVVSDDPLDGGGWRGSMEMDPWDHPIVVDLWRRPVIFIDSCNYDGTFTYSVDGEMIQVRAAGNISDLPDPGGVLWSLGKNGINEYGSGDDLLVRWVPLRSDEAKSAFRRYRNPRRSRVTSRKKSSIMSPISGMNTRQDVPDKKYLFGTERKSYKHVEDLQRRRPSVAA